MSGAGMGGVGEGVTALPHLPSPPFHSVSAQGCRAQGSCLDPAGGAGAAGAVLEVQGGGRYGGRQGGNGTLPGGGLRPCSFSPPAGQDVIAAILAELPAPGRTRRQVVKHLVRLGLANSAKDFPQQR